MQSTFSATTKYSQTIALPHILSRKYRYLMFWNDCCDSQDITLLRDLVAKDFVMYLVFGVTASKVRGILLLETKYTLPFVVEHMPYDTTIFPFSITGSADVALDCVTSMEVVFSGGAYHEDSVAISLLYALNVEEQKDKENTKEIQSSIFEEETDVETTDVE